MKRDLIQAAMVVVVTAIVYLSSPVYIFGDSQFTLLLGHNILRHGDLRLDEYLAQPLDPRLLRYRPSNRIYQIATIDGHSYYAFPMGSSVLSIPFIPIFNAFGWSAVRPDGGYDLDGELAMQRRLASLLMACLAGVFFWTARIVLPSSWSLVVALGGALGTQVWSTASRVLWSHTWGLLLLGLLLLLLVASERRQVRVNPFLLATLLSWMYFVRPVHVITIVTVSAYLLVRKYDRKWFFCYAITGVAWLLAFVACSYHFFDRAFPPYYLHGGFDLKTTLPVLKSYVQRGVLHLLSPSRGLFVYVPVVPFIGYLLVVYRRTLPSVLLTALGIINLVALGILVSGFRHWWGGHSYGPRLLIEAVPWLVLLAIMGIAGMQGRPRRLRVECAVGAMLLILSVAIHARGALSWDTVIWNYVPIDVDRRPQRLWDWRDAQMLAGMIRPLGSDAEIFDPRR